MSRSGILPALLVLTLSLCISSNAEARKRAWYYSNGFSAPFRDGDSQNTRAEGRRARIDGRGDQTKKRGNRAEERFGSTRATTGSGTDRAEPVESINAKLGSSSLSSTIDALIRACMQQAVEFQNWPLEDIARIAAPDDRQRAALEALRGAGAAAAERLSADCPRDLPPAAVERSQAVMKSIDAADSAFATIEPALGEFYAALDDEQKARLLRDLTFSKMQVTERELEQREQAGRQRSDANGGQNGKVNRWVRICEDLNAGLRAWPISEIERGMRLSDQQRIAFYELATSSLRAAQKLAGSCPNKETLTPVRRMALLRAGLAAVRDATAAIEPALTRFYEELDEGQRMRFAGMQ